MRRTGRRSSGGESDVQWVASSPFRVELIPVPPISSHAIGCFANVTCRTVKAGEAADFVVRPRDQYGNARSDSSGSVRYWLPPDEDMSLVCRRRDVLFLAHLPCRAVTHSPHLDYQTLFTSVPTFIQVIP